jgi:hypothetical protein
VKRPPRCAAVVRSAGVVRSAAVVAGLLGALASGPAAAQEPARTGFWLDAGAGYGRLRVRCADCSSTGTAYGGTVTVTLGRSLSRKVVLGLEGQVWTSWEEGAREQVRSLTVVAQWYPFRLRRFFVRGGTGLVQGPVVPSGTGALPESVKGTGVGLTLGVGYDLPLGERFGLAVQAASHVAALGDLALADHTTLDDTIAYVTRLSVALVVR